MSRSQEILESAEICMREKGFHQTSIKNVAAQANVSVGLIYKYYKNKEAIIEALVINVVKRMNALLNADFEKVAHARGRKHTPEDILPPELESSIMLLMEVSAEAMRNDRVKKIMDDAWHELKTNFITQEQALHPDQDADIILTKMYMVSLIIDGMIIRCCMKKNTLPPELMSFFNAVSNDVHQDN